MKKKYIYLLFALSFVAGICGAIFRTLQFDIEKGIFEAGTALTYVLIATCAVALVISGVAAFLTWKNPPKASDKPCILTSISLYVAAGIILIYAGMTSFLLREVISLKLLFSLKQSEHLATLVLVLFSIYCAVAFLVIAKNRMEERDSNMYNIFAAVPVFWACFMLILSFREKISDPIINNYVFHIFSYISILFFAYSIAAHLLGKKKKAIAVFSALLGTFFMLTDVIATFALLDYANFNVLDLRELVPQIAFILLIPGALYEIIRK